jgi:phosphonate transport system substrate-binding protein
VPAVPAGAPEIEGGTLSRLEAAGADRATLAVVWRSDVLRYGPHAVSSDLDPEPKRRLTAFLTGLKEADPDMYERLELHYLGGFTAASRTDYGPALDMMRMLAERPPRTE